ncbi:MAG: hypothetical protein QM786_08055 [Breznakibacter sp.]
MRRINLSLDKYAVFATEYARLANEDVFETAFFILAFRRYNKQLGKGKARIKQIFKLLTNPKSFSGT